ncbi:MAG: hypothetical protein FWF38_03305 [Spirochaetaceae bacterium]|nr:hypothetical protein [Spirochaetaceae bacterium]
MKKIILCFTACFLLCGTVWAQSQLGTRPGTLDIEIPRNWQGNLLFDSFYAPSAKSTESRYSAGIFSSYIDDYIDVNFFDPRVGTFLFLSTNPGSCGFSKTFNCFYLAVYYNGSTLNAQGDKTTIGDETLTSSHFLWENNLAFLIGTPNFGSFRLDLKLNTEAITEKNSLTEDSNKYKKNAPAIALTRGGVNLGGFEPYITIGYQFSDKHVIGKLDASDDYIEATRTSGSRAGVQTGVNYNFNENSRIWGDISFIRAFADKFKGDDDIINGADKDAFDGGWGVGLRAAYKQIFSFGKFSSGLSPNLTVAFIKDSLDSENTFSSNLFGVSVGLDVGFRFQSCAKLAFFTGASLHVLDCLILRDSDIDAWLLGGLEWGNKWDIASSSEASSLGLGMTLTPVNNLVIGAGFNALLDRFFFFDLNSFSFRKGDFFDKTKSDPDAWFDNISSGLKFDFTISYKF